MPAVVQLRFVEAIPPIFRKVVHAVPLKRATRIAPVRSKVAQIAFPALSPLQLGPLVVFPATFLNALHTVPLKNVDVRPPAAFRAAQSTFPLAKPVQLGSE